MYCQKCGDKTEVVDKVDAPHDEIYRKHKCKKCGHTFYTVEFEVDSYESIKDDWNKYHRSNIQKEFKK